MIAILTTLLLSVPVANLAPESTITVALPAEATVSGSEMTLGEIAVITGELEGEVQDVKDFALGYAPSPGYSRVIQSWRVEQQLAKEFPSLQISFTGKDTCRVWPRTAVISPRELVAAARKSLEGQEFGRDLEVSFRGELASETVPAGHFSRSVVGKPARGVASSGKVNVPVEILIDGEKYRTVWVTFDVTLYAELPVLRRAIPLGGRIKTSDVVMRRIEVSAGNTKDILQPSMLVGAIARRALANGQPVSARDVEREVAVKEGETVALEVSNGLVLVNTKVIALSSGFVGEVIPVRTLSTGKELTAIVTEAGHLKLRLGPSQAK